MRIVGKEISEKTTNRKGLIYTYKIKCRKCGYQIVEELPEKEELKIASMPCPKCTVTVKKEEPKAEHKKEEYKKKR